LVDPALSFGLPAFLTPEPGLKSGLMIAEVTSAALMSENKSLSNPRSVDSTPTSANQEDHVSMACHGARRLLEMNENLAGITSQLLQGVISIIREKCQPLNEDRIVSGDIESLATLVAKDSRLSDFQDLTPIEIDI